MEEPSAGRLFGSTRSRYYRRMIDQPNIAADAEIELETAARILGLFMPLLLRRLDDGRLRPRLEDGRHLVRREDVLKLKALEEAQISPLRELAEMDEIDYQPEPRF
jgi:hypothetical protein